MFSPRTVWLSSGCGFEWAQCTLLPDPPIWSPYSESTQNLCRIDNEIVTKSNTESKERKNKKEVVEYVCKDSRFLSMPRQRPTSQLETRFWLFHPSIDTLAMVVSIWLDSNDSKFMTEIEWKKIIQWDASLCNKRKKWLRVSNID